MTVKVALSLTSDAFDVGERLARMLRALRLRSGSFDVDRCGGHLRRGAAVGTPASIATIVGQGNTSIAQAMYAKQI